MDSIYKKFPSNMAPGDFWRQIKRTVNGEPVSDEQISMIVSTIRDTLQLAPDDQLLDLACGNGALSQYFFDDCHSFLGVDISEILIDVAKRYFEQPNRKFVLKDVGEYIVSEPCPQRFTKVLCYGSFSYFPELTARQVLTRLNREFVNVDRVFIGNLPDLELHEAFYTDGKSHDHELKMADSLIGIWRSPSEFEALAEDCGWRCSIQRMPREFYAGHYRYDVLLARDRA
ncbi:class I SAM-dependent methyltransferase [Pseudomonas sp. CK-NBRI-02]|uniref:class I SAM-dependent methyltransferase n=1 Tax=Pseudomonas sp. CK-NBRI-02 TaxID=2249759 RepID=UPI0005BE4D1D|nr:class I SAM-dependent methyltransferase [Pseudomonas sp. CK-NBRI-02]TYO82949.1 class I SAM-dependent methyltransferase [Pseudomonas sp. CK-NBRI-02]